MNAQVQTHLLEDYRSAWRKEKAMV